MATTMIVNPHALPSSSYPTSTNITHSPTSPLYSNDHVSPLQPTRSISPSTAASTSTSRQRQESTSRSTRTISGPNAISSISRPDSSHAIPTRTDSSSHITRTDSSSHITSNSSLPISTPTTRTSTASTTTRPGAPSITTATASTSSTTTSTSTSIPILPLSSIGETSTILSTSPSSSTSISPSTSSTTQPVAVSRAKSSPSTVQSSPRGTTSPRHITPTVSSAAAEALAVAHRNTISRNTSPHTSGTSTPVTRSISSSQRSLRKETRHHEGSHSPIAEETPIPEQPSPLLTPTIPEYTPGLAALRKANAAHHVPSPSNHDMNIDATPAGGKIYDAIQQNYLSPHSFDFDRYRHSMESTQRPSIANEYKQFFNNRSSQDFSTQGDVHEQDPDVAVWQQQQELAQGGVFVSHHMLTQQQTSSQPASARRPKRVSSTMGQGKDDVDVEPVKGCCIIT